MMAEQFITRLKDAPMEIIDGDRGVNYPAQDQFTSDGYCVFLSAKNVRRTGLDLSDCQFISKERDQLLRKGKLQRFDSVLTTRGTVGNLGFYDERIPFDNIRINSGMVIIRPDRKKLDESYCFFMLRGLQGEFTTFSTGTAQPQLPIKDLNEIKVRIPDLPEQRAIASILSSLDDKIDLLHRQNRTLEQLAQTLFRQWFVEEGDAGWEAKTLGDVVSVKGGTTPSTSVASYWDGGIHWTSPRDLSNVPTLYMRTTAKTLTETGLAQIGSGLLPLGTVLLSSRAPIGYVAITSIPVAINQGYIAIICDKGVSNYFMFLWLKANMDAIIGAANGSVFLEISKSVFKSLDFQLPPNGKLKNFDEIVSPFFEKINANEQQIQTLTQLRDTLLPKLMSGEVRVKQD